MVVMVVMVLSPGSVAAPVERHVSKKTGVGGARSDGAGRRPAGRWPRGAGGRPCGHHTPRGSGNALPPGGASAHTARMTCWDGCAGVRAASCWPRCSCWGGLAASCSLVYVVVVLGGGVLHGRHFLAARGPLRARDRDRRAGLRPRPDPARGRRVPHGARRPALAVRRAAAVLRDRDRQLPGRGAAGPDGAGARRRAPVRSGRRYGWSWATGPGWPPPGPRGDARGERPGPAQTDRDAPGRRSLPVRHRGELLGVLVVQERDQVPLTSVEERLFDGLADQAGLVLRGARLRAELGQRLEELSTRAEELRLPPAPGRRAGRAAPTPRARHPRRRPAAPGGAGGEPPTGPDAGRGSPDRSVQILGDQRLGVAPGNPVIAAAGRSRVPPVPRRAVDPRRRSDTSRFWRSSPPSGPTSSSTVALRRAPLHGLRSR